MQGKFLTRQGISLDTVTTDPVIQLVRRAGRFRRPLHVAMQHGLYHHLTGYLREMFGVQSLRIPETSESKDSEYLWPFLLIVRTRRIITSLRW